MTGIPSGMLCFISVAEPPATGNLTFYGQNSTMDNCRVRVCNAGGTQIDPGLMNFSALAVAIAGT